MTISVLLADDHAMFRKGLHLLIAEEPDMRVVGEAADGNEAIEKVLELSPDVVVMDITMPNLNGIEATQEIVGKAPDTKVVALSIHSAKRFVKDMLAAGASGYISKDNAPEELINCIRKVIRNEVYLSSEITGVVISGFLKEYPGERTLESPDNGSIDYSEYRLFTKLHRPPCKKNHIHRQPLLKSLDEGMRLPLTLVVAPAGYGKTSAVSGWLEAVSNPSAWVSLDKNDNELRLFLNCLLSAIQTICADACRDTQFIVNEIAAPSVSVLADNLIKEFDQIEQRFVLVLDDFHLIKDQSIIDLVTQLLRHPPSMLHLVLIGRRDPPLPLSRLRARNWVREIRTQHLRFSKMETATYLAQELEQPIDPGIAAVLEEKTEGWVSGLHLAALSMRHRGELDPKLLNAQVNAQYVMEYLFEEVFANQPPEIARFLLCSAILDRFTGPLCEAVYQTAATSPTDNITGWQFIDWLKKENLFIIPLDAENRWFRFHHLFKKLLVNQLNRRLSPKDISALHTQASTWFAENGMIAEALEHARKEGDMTNAVRLAVKYGFDLLKTGMWPELERCLNNLPIEIVAQDPELLVLQSWLHMVYARYSEMGSCLDKSEALSESLTIAEPILGHRCILRSFQHYLSIDAERALTLTRQAFQGVPRDHQWARLNAYSVQGLAYQMRGDRTKTIATVEETMRDANLSSELKGLSTMVPCVIYWIDADLKNMIQMADQPLKFGAHHRESEAMANSHYFLGIAHYHRNELDVAEKNLLRVIQNADSLHALNYVHGAFALAFIHQSSGREDEANQLGGKMVSYAVEVSNPELLHVVRAFKAELAIRQGRFGEAFRWAEHYDAHPFWPMCHFYIPQLTYAKILMLQDTKAYRHQALELLNQLHAFLKSVYNFRFQIDTLALKALLFDLQNDESAAISALAKSLAIAEPGGFIRPFLDLGMPMADLLKKLIAQNIAVEYSGQILSAVKGEQKKAIQTGANVRPAQMSHSNTQPLVEPLSIREQEVLNLLVYRLSNKEIADKLYIAPTTVKKHLNNIYGKLSVSNRRQAVEKAEILNILSLQ